MLKSHNIEVDNKGEKIGENPTNENIQGNGNVQIPILKKRHKKHLKFKNKNHKCEVCEKAFFTKNQVKTHVLRHHTEKNLDDLKCSHCEKTYICSATLKRHISEVHQAKSLPCEICSKMFKSKRVLKNHIELVHEGVKKARELARLKPPN